jgi:NTP pyrophosphatase (non-canonical NTP hydrolase)
MEKSEQREIISKAVSIYGFNSQASMIIEECAELITATNQLLRGRITIQEWASEIADVEITTEVLRAVYGDELVETEKEKKLIRLQERITAATVNQSKETA